MDLGGDVIPGLELRNEEPHVAWFDRRICQHTPVEHTKTTQGNPKQLMLKEFLNHLKG